MVSPSAAAANKILTLDCWVLGPLSGEDIEPFDLRQKRLLPADVHIVITYILITVDVNKNNYLYNMIKQRFYLLALVYG